MKKLEEPVRQEFIRILSDDYGYRDSEIATELPIPRGSNPNDKADIAVFKGAGRDPASDVIVLAAGVTSYDLLHGSPRRGIGAKNGTAKGIEPQKFKGGAAGRVRAGRGAAPGWPEGAARHWPPSGGRRR